MLRGFRAIVVALAVVITSCAGDGNNGTERAGVDEKTRALFAGITDDSPGCSVAVNSDGNIVFAEAYGAATLDPAEPFEAETVVDIGSTSKQFTAIATGLLVVDDMIAVDDPVSAYVSDLPDWSDDVTVGQLLTHTSGIPDYIELLQDAGVDLLEPAGQQDALDVLAAAELDFQPGSRFEYSNSNYVLLAEVVLAASGSDLAAFLDEAVFGPRDMDAAMEPAAVQDGKAASYELDRDDWAIADSPWTQLGDGAVQTTPSELARFAEIYWSDDAEAVALADLRDEIGVDTGEGRYSLGIEAVDLDGETVLSHEGSWSGFETLFVAAPDRRAAVAVTCNSPDVDVDLDGLEVRILELWSP